MHPHVSLQVLGKLVALPTDITEETHSSIHPMVHLGMPAKNLDTSKRYFTTERGIQFVNLPNAPSPMMASEIGNYIKPKISEMVDSGLDKLILNAGSIEQIDMTIIKLILFLARNINFLDLIFR